ncbi:MAG: NAD(P)H-dependent oxidoreductase [Myxococcota bacterium]
MSHSPAPHRAGFSPRVGVPDEGRVLVLYCHPQPHRSRVNRALIRAIDGLDGVTVHDLYEAYPDHGIDVPHEQALLAAHHTIVLQHPFYWYSTPPLLKEWLDVVLTWGWAYGVGGTALRGKRMLQAISTGGGEAAYAVGGSHRFTILELLAPMVQTAHLCGIEYLPPFVVHGTHRLEDAAIASAAADYRRRIELLREAAGAARPTAGHGGA